MITGSPAPYVRDNVGTLDYAGPDANCRAVVTVLSNDGPFFGGFSMLNQADSTLIVGWANVTFPPPDFDPVVVPPGVYNIDFTYPAGVSIIVEGVHDTLNNFFGEQQAGSPSGGLQYTVHFENL